MKDKIINRFLRYIQIDTQSDENSKTYPSTQKQFDLARLLEKELKNLGLAEVELDNYGYVTATLPSNIKKDISLLNGMYNSACAFRKICNFSSFYCFPSKIN
jgi:tripeptide aminopeptidase